MFPGVRGQVVYQPKGVVGNIAPWNYPIFLALSPATYALAAGNRMLIKVSEHAPRTGRLMMELLADEFSEDLLAAVEGPADLAATFSALPFDHLLLTGSPAVGRSVMRAAAQHLTPVTLELGGKSPAVLDHSVSIEMAAQRLCFAKAVNAGQTCVAPDYVFVPQGRERTFVEAFTRAFSSMYPTLRDNPDYTSVINESHYNRLKGYLDDARAGGAEVVKVNPSGEQIDPKTRKLPIHLVLGATGSMKLMQEEIFGPLLPVLPYSRIDEVMAFINARPRPLALYYFGNDRQVREHLVTQTHSGAVGVNDAAFHVVIDDLPFGGIGNSGMGAYHGREGFLTFSHAKSILTRSASLNSSRFLYPPYGRRLHLLLIKLLLR